jgi:hypothetical protein
MLSVIMLAARVMVLGLMMMVRSSMVMSGRVVMMLLRGMLRRLCHDVPPCLMEFTPIPAAVFGSCRRRSAKVERKRELLNRFYRSPRLVRPQKNQAPDFSEARPYTARVVHPHALPSVSLYCHDDRRCQTLGRAARANREASDKRLRLIKGSQRAAPVVPSEGPAAGGGVWSRSVDPGVPLGPGLLATCTVFHGPHARIATARMNAAITASARKLIEPSRS